MPRTRAQARREAAEAKNKFALFPRLPVEIRFQIWEFVCQHSRVIGVWGGYYNPRLAQFLGIKRDLQVQRLETPPILHASHEARTVALKHYTRAFRTDEYPQYQVNRKGIHQAFIFINRDVDIFYHTTDSAASLFKGITKPTRYRACVEESDFERSGSFLFRGEYHYLKELIIARFEGKVGTFAIQERIKNALPIEFQFRKPTAAERTQVDGGQMGIWFEI